MDPDRRALSSRSPATRYEVLLVEDTPKKGLSEERMATCFHVFDEVIPCIGVYKKVLKMLRDELYDAVYSDEYTTMPPKKSKSKTPYIQRIPFFVLVNRVFEERDKNADVLRANITELENKLNEKDKQLKERNQSIQELRKTLKEGSDKIYNMEIELENNSLEQRKLAATIQYEQMTQQAAKERYERRISSLKEELAQAKERNYFLEKFKEGYDALEEAFNDSAVFEKNPKKPAILTRKAQIIQEIASAKLLEEQLLTMQNAIIEEFEFYLEETKATPTSDIDLKGSGSESNFRATPDDEHEARIKQEENLHKVKERFKLSIIDIKSEFQLIEIQRSSLEDQLAQLEDEADAMEKEAAKKTERKKSLFHIEREKDNQPNEEEDNEEIDFVKIMNSAHHQDPFIPHEKILSKYAAMLYYSCNQGKNYHEFKDARFCPSCGETTLLCPHKVTDHKVLSLPHNCTHIKIVRPTVHILQEERHTEHIPQTPDSVTGTLPAIRPSSTLFYEEASILQAQQHLTTSYKCLWDDYYSRTSSQRQIPRSLSEDRVLSIIEQFYSSLIWQDDYAVEDEQIVSVVDTLYSFFHERYLVPEVMYLAVYDFLASVVKFSPDNKSIQLFAQAMCGSLDPVVIRYVLLVNDFIDMVEWVAVKEIRTFASVLYPFMNEEDIEQFAMGYTSFSENKISKDLVSQYFVYIILKYREPRFQEIEVKLLQQPGRRPGFMTDIEYSEAVDNICPLASERLRRRLFVESAAHIGSTDDSVSVMRLAQITGYLILLQLTPVIKDSVVQKIQAVQPVVKGDQTVFPDTPLNGTSKLANLQTTTTARAVAAENAKRSRTRQLQRIEEYNYQ
ncbi:centromere-associated protein E-like [Montipora foliosa]|uniref:centromere-associated protein E-like n=1 Tax=Montipora foliosa TaxID=591990 RepID=UPI0035F21BB9